MAAARVISHAFVLPDRDFDAWLAALRPYLAKFNRVTVVRSPAGNNLNRFRNVTAVEAPLTWWQDSALTHIRRVYPSVVMVDVIAVERPAELAPILARRIENDDRYGEQDKQPQHIFQRFVLEWMTSARPMAVLDAFNADSEKGELRPSLDILTRPDAAVLSGAPGRVIAAGQGIQIESVVENQRFITSYAGVKAASGQVRRYGRLGAGHRQSRWRAPGHHRAVSATGREYAGLAASGEPARLYLHSAASRAPLDRWLVTCAGCPALMPASWAESIAGSCWSRRSIMGRAMEKIGARGSWLKARAISGVEGYGAASYLGATTLAEGAEALPGVNPVGVNLDIYHPQGKPAPAKLGGIGWVRFGYNVSNGSGSEDIEAALARYLPRIAAYRRAGYRVILVLSHQTYGEGKNEFWPWSQMTDCQLAFAAGAPGGNDEQDRAAMGGAGPGGCLAGVE